MVHKYIITIEDTTTGREAVVEATGNTVAIAGGAALLHCQMSRAEGGHGMSRPVVRQIEFEGLV